MSEKSNSNKITRRELLKMMGVSVGAGMVNAAQAPLRSASRAFSWLEAASADPQAEFGGKLFRGTVDGCIHVSTDGGKSWKLLTCLHRGCTVTALKANRSGLVATLEFAGHLFSLQSSDGKLWKTV